MLSVPLPFVVSLLLGIAFVRLARRDGVAANPRFLAMLAAYAVQSVLLGLRWGYGLVAIQPLQAVLAAAIPPLSWVGFSTCVTHGPRRAGDWVHALPPLAAAVLWLAARWLIDPALEMLFVGYGIALLRLGRRGPDALEQVTLDGAIPLLRALRATGIMLVTSAAIDLAIALDLLRWRGLHAGLIAGLSSLGFIALLGWAATIAGDNASLSAAAEPLPAATPPDPGDADVIEALEALMRERQLHRDPGLTLDRLARRIGLPARRVSGAINRIRGMNVSQYVNGHRVADACRMLADSDAPITQVIFESGFQTKSNFNREFLRVTGRSPSAWRAAALAPSAGSQLS